MIDRLSSDDDATDRPETAPIDEATPQAVLVEDELLVEDVSIDGLCGVY